MTMSTESTHTLAIRRISTVLPRGLAVIRSLDTSAKVALGIILVIVLIGVAAPLIAPYGPAEPDYDTLLSGPTLDHPMGTDNTGRDVFSRLIFGTRISLLVGVFAVGLAMAIGVPAGSVAGYVGGWVDESIMRVMDIAISFPALVLALALVGSLGPSLQNIVIVIGVVYSPQYARLIRGEVLSVKEEEYVEAAKGTGVPDLKILYRHVIPNSFQPIIVQGTFHVATAIIFEASLSFLGLGVQPPTPSWGVMIANGRGYLPDAWWITTFPGIAIMITVLSYNILGDSLQDKFDPQSKTKGGPDA